MTEGIFLYYLAGKKREELKPADFADNPILAGPFFDLIHSPRLFRDKLIGVNVVNAGPDNGSGCVVSVQPECERNQNLPHYNAATQTWRKFGDQWIGWQTDMLPGPESLRRPSQLQGYEVELGDGRVWIAPVVKQFREDQRDWVSQLPMVWGIDENMSATATPVEKFRSIWDVSAQIWAATYGGSNARMSDCFGWAAQCLGMNYRIGAVEASLLKLFPDDAIREVLHAAVDDPVVRVIMEKQEAPENPQ